MSDCHHITDEGNPRVSGLLCDGWVFHVSVRFNIIVKSSLEIGQAR